MNLPRMGKGSKLLHVKRHEQARQENACRQPEIRKAAEMQRRKTGIFITIFWGQYVEWLLGGEKSRNSTVRK